MTQVQVHVAINGQDVPAGTLYPHRRSGAESATFTCEGGYLAATGAYAVDPELPWPAEPEIDYMIDDSVRRGVRAPP